MPGNRRYCCNAVAAAVAGLLQMQLTGCDSVAVVVVTGAQVCGTAAGAHGQGDEEAGRPASREDSSLSETVHAAATPDPSRYATHSRSQDEDFLSRSIL